MKLDKRLEAVLAEIPRVELLCDIGADHGKLSAEAVIRGMAERVIASDISAASIAKAADLFFRLGISDKAVTRVGDGLEPAGLNANAFVIAGMGGRTIVGILERGGIIKALSAAGLTVAGGIADARGPIFIFAPQRDERYLREYLIHNGFKINRESTVAFAGKYYQIITASVSASGVCGYLADSDDYLSDLYLEFGRYNIEFGGQDFLNMLLDKKNGFDKAIQKRYNVACAEKLRRVDTAIALYREGHKKC